MESVALPYEPRGGVAKVFRCRDPEILLESMAGSGKSRGCLELALWAAETFPGCRILFLRQTQSSLRDSILPIWEQEVLWEGHPALGKGAMMENRHSYNFPYKEDFAFGKWWKGRTQIVLGGLDKPENTFSAQYDLVFVFEAFQITFDAWEKLYRLNRNFKMPFQLMIAETNPANERHWLNLRAEEEYTVPPELADVLPPAREGQKMMTRIRCHIRDNPKYYDERKYPKGWSPEGAVYMARLHRYTGTNRQRMLDGIWCTEEGAVWGEFDPERHLIPKEMVPGYKKATEDVPEVLHELDWFFASFDQGYSQDPGVLQVWGVKMDGRKIKAVYLVAEWYRLHKHLDWWADRVVDAYREFEVVGIACDPSSAAAIDLFNDHLSEHCGRDVGRIAQKAVNRIRARASWDLAGIDLVGEMIAEDRVFIVKGSLRGQDQELVEKKDVWCTRDSILGYSWPKDEDGKPTRAKPDPACRDDGCDATRYALCFAWRRDHTPKPTKKVYGENTYGSILRHKERRDAREKRKRAG